MQVNSTLSVKTFDVGPMLNMIYLIWDKKTKEAALVDPAWDLSQVLDFIKKNNINLKKILLTHSHHDHVNSVDKLLSLYDVPIYINKIRVPASYLNFYIFNKFVLLPTFNDPKDKTVIEIFKKEFNNRKIIPIDCSELIWGFGAIHCLTQQEPK